MTESTPGGGTPQGDQPATGPAGQPPHDASPYQAAPPSWQGAGPTYGYPPRRTNAMAVVALVVGIAGLTVVPLIGSIVAVIVAPIARREIARTGEEGWGMATAGLVTGWIGIGLTALVVLFFVLMAAFGLGLASVAAATAGA